MDVLAEIKTNIAYWQDNQRSEDLNDLSAGRIRLASLNATLGEEVGRLRGEADSAEFKYNRTALSKEMENRKNGMGVAESKTHAEYDSLEERRKAVDGENHARMARTLYESVSKLLDALSSRINVLSSEKRQNYS